MQLNKNIKIFFNYFFAPVLFVWLLFSLYQQIKEQPFLAESWVYINNSFQSWRILLLLLAFLLVIANWGIEAWKWKLSVASITKLSFLKAFKATLSGVSFSVTMPNRVGEYFGRILYMPEGARLKTVSVTLVASIAQLLVTLTLGFAGLIVLKENLLNANIIGIVWYQFLLFGVLAIMVVLTFFYFGIANAEQLLEKWFRKSKHLYLIQSLRTFNVQLLSKLYLLSFLRYIVFAIQYLLLFYFFGVQVSPVLMWWVVSVIFLAMAIIPSVALVEIGLRGEISLKLMGMFTANSLAIGLTALSIWIINLVIPAIVGSLLIFSIKVFNRKDENV